MGKNLRRCYLQESKEVLREINQGVTIGKGQESAISNGQGRAWGVLGQRFLYCLHAIISCVPLFPCMLSLLHFINDSACI